MTIVELMVAVLIGLLSMYAVYRVYEGTERTKRNIVAVGDVQVSGLYSIFLLEQDIHNAGSGIMANPLNAPANGQALANCGTGGAMGGVASPAALTLRPLPVVIDAAPANPNFDDVYVFSGTASSYITPLNVSAVNVAGAIMTATVTTPYDFFKNGDVLVDVGANGAAPPVACQAYLATPVVPSAANCVPPPPATPTTCSATVNLQGAATPAVDTRLVNLGAPARHRFYVNPANNTLLMENWVLNTAGTWSLNRIDPIVTGVVSFRAQYGIAPQNGNGINGIPVNQPINQWVVATSPWDMATVLTAPWATIQQIKAVRLSIIIRADEPEVDPNVAATLPTAFTQFAGCPGAAGTTCPAAITTALPAGLRYRMYETVVPLKNTLWNP